MGTFDLFVTNMQLIKKLYLINNARIYYHIDNKISCSIHNDYGIHLQNTLFGFIGKVPEIVSRNNICRRFPLAFNTDCRGRNLMEIKYSNGIRNIDILKSCMIDSFF